MLNKNEITFWQENGFLKITNYYSPSMVMQMKTWALELSALPEVKRKWMFYYEKSFNNDSRMLCRIENFANYHLKFKEVLFNKEFLSLLKILFNEECYLFKEKINFKFPGGNGFSPHQDAPAFSIFGQQYHITVMICIDDSNEINGCMEFASGRHLEGLFDQEANGDIAKNIVEHMKWRVVSAHAGDIIIFDSYIPHRSGPNQSDFSRRALFATYNKKSNSERREEYYTIKREYFPPEYEREAGKDYSKNNPFNLGNPIK